MQKEQEKKKEDESRSQEKEERNKQILQEFLEIYSPQEQQNATQNHNNNPSPQVKIKTSQNTTAFEHSSFRPFLNWTTALICLLFIKHKFEKNLYNDICLIIKHCSFKSGDMPPNYDAIKTALEGMPNLPILEAEVENKNK